MAFRKDLPTILSAGPRSVSSLARELGLTRGVGRSKDLRHTSKAFRD